MVKIHQHVKFQANPSMHSPANARKPLRTDGRTCRKTVTVGRVDQRTHVQVKRGYFRLRTDGRTDGQPENIMPPAPKGGGIKNNDLGQYWSSSKSSYDATRLQWVKCRTSEQMGLMNHSADYYRVHLANSIYWEQAIMVLCAYNECEINIHIRASKQSKFYLYSGVFWS